MIKNSEGVYVDANGERPYIGGPEGFFYEELEELAEGRVEEMRKAFPPADFARMSALEYKLQTAGHMDADGNLLLNGKIIKPIFNKIGERIQPPTTFFKSLPGVSKQEFRLIEKMWKALNVALSTETTPTPATPPTTEQAITNVETEGETTETDDDDVTLVPAPANSGGLELLETVKRMNNPLLNGIIEQWITPNLGGPSWATMVSWITDPVAKAAFEAGVAAALDLEVEVEAE